MSLNTIVTIKQANGQEIALVDWTDKPLFSSVDLQNGFTQQEIVLFNYTSGDVVPGYAPVPPNNRTATDNDTNLAQPGTMASTEEMLIYAIKPEIYFYLLTETGDFTTRTYNPDINAPGLPIPTAQGLAVLFQQIILELEISQSKKAQSPLGYFNPGFGVMKTQGSGSAASASAGLPSQNAVRSFVIPSHIGSEEKYKVTLRNSGEINNGAVSFGIFETTTEAGTVINPLACATIRVLLDGLYKRPVS
jgi:hypothetical protein